MIRYRSGTESTGARKSRKDCRTMKTIAEKTESVIRKGQCFFIVTIASFAITGIPGTVRKFSAGIHFHFFLLLKVYGT